MPDGWIALNNDPTCSLEYNQSHSKIDASRLIAQGTPDEMIIFTSDRDINVAKNILKLGQDMPDSKPASEIDRCLFFQEETSWLCEAGTSFLM